MKKIIIGNWKMVLAPAVAQSLAVEIGQKVQAVSTVETVICPSFTALAMVAWALGENKLNLGLGAQDVYWQDSGAYTGEESPATLAGLGCRYVIVGHSERRQGLGETDQMVHNKTAAAIKNKLTPIVCVGETQEERHEGRAEATVHRQLTAALQGIDLVGTEQIVVAYEPIWAIGRGQAVTPEVAQSMVQIIYQTLLDLFPLTIVESNVRIVYGGSVDSEVAQSFGGLEHLAGFLVGGASVKTDSFVSIINNWS